MQSCVERRRHLTMAHEDAPGVAKPRRSVYVIQTATRGVQLSTSKNTWVRPLEAGLVVLVASLRPTTTS
eukprot:8493053-Pyramimonas_sp.AAC.1